MLLREEFFTTEHNVKMKRIFYGNSEDEITSVVEVSVIDEKEMEDVTEAAVLSETDEAILNTNLNVEYLIALQELGF